MDLWIWGPAALALVGCDRTEILAPPVIHYGQHECVVCRMIISDDRYAAAAITLDERGRHQPLVFDDIGCIFEYEANNPEAPLLARYVRHVHVDEWLDAQKAEYVHSRELQTPMAFGVAALASLEQARALHVEVGGELITLDEARRRFNLGTLHVSALDGGTPFIAALESEKTLALNDGREFRLSLAVPQVLSPGKHEFKVTAEARTDSGSWSHKDDLALLIEPEMPTMGHGSPDNEHPNHVADGLYRGKVDFTMAGYWLVHIVVRENGVERGRTSFAFEVKR